MPFRDKFNSNEEYNAWFREYRQRNLEKRREYGRVYNQKWRKRFGFDSNTRYRKRNPGKVHAHVVARYYLKVGYIVKESCFLCGDSKSEMHHPDYSKPTDVIFLCRVCHVGVHRHKQVINNP